MDTRNVQFGSITLETNGYHKSVYSTLFDPEHLPGPSGHPQVWAGEALRELIGFAQIPPEQLKEGVHAQLITAAKHRLHPDEIAERNQAAARLQSSIDEKASYPETRGYFTDYQAAHAYCREQMRVGPNSISGRLHDDLFIHAKGEGTLISAGGVHYRVKPWIWIEGQKHTWDSHTDLKWPLLDSIDHEEANEKTRSDLHRFLLTNAWTDGLRCKREYIKEKRGDGPWRRKLNNHAIISDELDCGMHVHQSGFFSMSTCAPLYGVLANLERFSQSLIDQLDPFFKKISK